MFYWLYRFIWIVVIVLLAISFWKIFEKAWEHGRYALIPIFDVFIVSRIAQKINNFRYLLWWAAWALLFWYWHISILFILCSIFASVQGYIISYSVAQHFWWRTSASIVFALSPWIKWIVLWLSSDQYIFENGQVHHEIKIPPKKPIDANILNDIENEIHTKHLWETNNTNSFGEDYWTDDNIWDWSVQYPQNISTSQNIPNSQNIQPSQTIQSPNNYNDWSNQNIVN